jgi:hypothetical protein
MQAPSQIPKKEGELHHIRGHGQHQNHNQGYERRPAGVGLVITRAGGGRLGIVLQKDRDGHSGGLPC